MGVVIVYAGIGLGPDEAQYWTWSQDLDWGYYSKPPGIAWQIWLGTKLFGNTEFGVRFLTIIIGVAIPLFIYVLAKNCGLNPKTCFGAAIAMSLSPLGIFASFLAITDGGMILFWTIACAYLAFKVRKKERPNYVILGFLIFGGALFKWPIYWLWLFVFSCWPFFRFFISWNIVLGIVISLGALLPSLYWNVSHEWATFRHVLATMSGGHGHGAAKIFSGNSLEFIGAQAALISPIFFIFLLLAFGRLLRDPKRLPDTILFCMLISFLSLAFNIFFSLFIKIQGNWAVFAYPTAFVVISWFAFEEARSGKIWFVGGLVFSLLSSAFVLSIPTLQAKGIFNNFSIPYKINPFRHNMGWHELMQELKKSGYQPDRDFLFGDKYQSTSILSFYSPRQKLAYFFNLQGIRKNQFSFWPDMAQEQKNRDGFFVVTENLPNIKLGQLEEEYEKKLSPYFKKIKFIGLKPIFTAYGKVVKVALIYKCEQYNGELPKDTELY